MLLPEFAGGLGNLMFQMAGLYGIAKQTGHRFGINTVPINAHSPNHNLKNTIFKPWDIFSIQPDVPLQRFEECWSHPIDLESFRNRPDTEVIVMNGWYQHVHYFHQYRDEIIPLFTIQPLKRNKYYDIDDAYFLHVRRTDFIGHPFVYLNLEANYYPRALEQMKQKGVAYVCSDDPAYCEDWSMLQDVRHRVIHENEIDTLSIMKSCKKGGIAANSSFSWWGLYLDTSRSSLLMPCTWFPVANFYGYTSERYRFPEATVVSIW